MKPLTILLVFALTLLCARAANIPDVMVLEEEDEDKRDKRALGFIAEKISSKFASKFGYHEGPAPIPPPRHELEYGPPISYHTKNFDIWGFKKAIFNALFQAVKAIKGGIIAFKGQLLKAKGHILQTKGGILAAKGDAITNFGRQLAAKSLLEQELVYDGPLEGPIPITGPSGYAASTSNAKESVPPPLPTKSIVPEYKPPEPTYEAPLSTASNYGQYKEEPKQPPKDYGQSGLPGGVKAGLLVLKPISVPPTGGAGGQFAEPPGSYGPPQQATAASPSYEGSSQSFGGNSGSFGGPPYSGGSSPFGGESQSFGGGSQSFGGGSQSFGGGSQPFGGGSQSFGGGSQSFGGGSQSFGGGSQPFGGGSQSFGGGGFGGGPPSFGGGYAGPLSPSAYDSFGGNADLSASYSQSAVQSKQRKRASPLLLHHGIPPPPQFGRPHILYQNPNIAFRH